jgi:SAM-dependent methyltransferase
MMSSLSFDQTPEGWGDVATGYEKAMEGLTSQYAAEVVRLLQLRSGEKVLDVAAGPGAFTLAAARAGTEVVATDFAPGMIARLRERVEEARLTGVTAQVMDGQALTLPDASFDASACILGVIFFPDIAKGLAELRRVLRPGGRSAVVCWSDPKKMKLWALLGQALRSVVPEFQAPAPVWARLMGADVLQAAMERAGFARVQVTMVTRSLRVPSPQRLWSDFFSSAPPSRVLMEKLGPERCARVGEAFVKSMLAQAGGSVPELSAEVCVGIGWAEPSV